MKENIYVDNYVLDPFARTKKTKGNVIHQLHTNNAEFSVAGARNLGKHALVVLDDYDV